MDLNQLYLELLEKYRVAYPHNPVGVLKYHLNKIKLPLETGIIILAFKNGIKIPEVEKLLSEGKSLEEAAKILSKDTKIEPSSISRLERQVFTALGFEKVKIIECDDLPENWNVSLYGRIIALFVGEPLYRKLPEDLGIDKKLQFTLKDSSGMILVEVDYPVDLTLMKGTIVKVDGTIRLYENKKYVSASNIIRLQPVENAFHDLSLIEIENIRSLPNSQGNRLIKPLKGDLAETVTIGKERKFELFVFGCILCAVSFVIPVVSLLLCLAGCILIVLGLFTEASRVKGFEIARLLIEHHPPWLRNRCISFKIFNKKIYLCARCSGIILGFIATSIISFETSNPYLVTLLALPAMIDWGTQKLGFRESINQLRFVTGFLLGGALCFSKYLSFNVKLLITSIFLISALIIMAKSIIALPKQNKVCKILSSTLPN